VALLVEPSLFFALYGDCDANGDPGEAACLGVKYGRVSGKAGGLYVCGYGCLGGEVSLGEFDDPIFIAGFPTICSKTQPRLRNGIYVRTWSQAGVLEDQLGIFISISWTR
jgi:hypothetical protein